MHCTEEQQHRCTSRGGGRQSRGSIRYCYSRRRGWYSGDDLGQSRRHRASHRDLGFPPGGALMANATLFDPIFDGGIRSIKFFNGRLLSGEDLTKEQGAEEETLRR